MDRHVIKGRGANRGKYLCWARMAPGETPTEDGFVWLPEQRKAVRWQGPRSGRTWATDRARLHDGYFVRLICSPAITAGVDDLRRIIAERAQDAIAALPCHWFDGDFHDAGEDFCRSCAEKLVDEKYAADTARFEELYGECDGAEARYQAAIHGGYDIDHDSPPYCETCEVSLSGYLTDSGADQEIEAYTDGREGLGPGDWNRLDAAIVDLADDDPRWSKIARVVKAATVIAAPDVTPPG